MTGLWQIILILILWLTAMLFLQLKARGVSLSFRRRMHHRWRNYRVRRASKTRKKHHTVPGEAELYLSKLWIHPLHERKEDDFD